MTSGGIRSGATARKRIEVARRAAGPASRVRRARSVGASRPRSVPCASISEVIVSGPDPGHPCRPEQHRGRVADLGQREFRAARPSGRPDRPPAGQGSRRPPRTRERGRHGAVRIGRHDDDRQRATGPGKVRQATDPRLTERVGERALGGGGQDDGGDGHARECTRPRDGQPLRSRIRGTIGRPARLGEPTRPCPMPLPDDRNPDTAPDRHRRPRRPAQRRDRRPCRPRQDHAGRRDAAPDGRLPLEPGRRRPGDGFGRPRAREGHHDPRQADDGRSRRRPAQHRRHAGPRRLRRRGRALAADGRFGAAARRRRRGPAAADPLRPPEGDGAAAPGRRRDQQDRPRRRPPGRGPRRHLRAVHGPRRRRAPDRVPDRLHERQGRHRDARPRPSPGRTCGRCSTCSSRSRRR